MDSTQLTGQSKSRVRAARYRPEASLIVASKTIGTNLVFDLTTENISRSGMLLSWESGTPIPFIESTILEMTIDPGCRYLEKPVSCLGKIVRKQDTSHTSASVDVSFGINIIQIDERDLEEWETCVANLAAKSSPVVTEDPALKMKSVRKTA